MNVEWFFIGFGTCIGLVALTLYILGWWAKRHQEKIARVVIRKTMGSGRKRDSNHANHPAAG